MANFCPNCASALDADAKFCPSCSTPISYVSAIASEIRSDVGSRVSAFVRSSSLSVAPPIWAGVIQVFWLLFDAFQGVWMTLLAVGVSAAGGAAGLVGQAGAVERVMFAALIYSFYYLALFSFELPLAYGMLTLKRWAYGLYFKGMCPMIVLGVILRVLLFALLPNGPRGTTATAASDNAPLSIVMLGIAAVLLIIALIIIQFVLMLRSKDHLVN